MPSLITMKCSFLITTLSVIWPSVFASDPLFDLSFLPDGLSSDRWENVGALGSDYDIDSIHPGYVDTDTVNGEDVSVLCFDRSKEMATMPFDLNQPEVTVATWVRVDELPSDYTFIMSCDDASWDRSIGLYFGDGTKGMFLGGAGGAYTSTLGYPPIGEWMHIVATWSYENDQVAMYLNGGTAAGGSQQIKTGNTRNWSSKWTYTGINRSPYKSGTKDMYSLNGCLTQIQAAYRVLSAEEIAAVYNSELAQTPTSATPTTSPSVVPTASPSEPQCDASEQHAVNWHDLLNSDEPDTSLLTKYAADFEDSTLSLTFKTSMKYVGKSADGSFDHAFNLGTTYWIDFQSFSSVDGGVDSPGNCGNRRSADYSNLDFAEMWEYPVNPADLDSVSTAERMAYPPSDWTLNAVNCTSIQYERSLSWADLTECQDAAGNDLITIEDTNDAVKLKGTFFVELLSPYSMSSDEYFRTFPLVQQGFEIVLNKQIDVISSTGTQLFIASVMAYGRDDEGKYEVTVLIQSADYVSMNLDDVAAVTGPLTISDVETVAADCLVATSFTCGQIFTAKIDAPCPEDGVVDLSGSYQFAFTPQCRLLDDGTTTDPACDTFMTTLDESSGKVALAVDASFIDLCEVDLFTVQFTGDLTFYSDDQFAVAVDANSVPFVIGQDTIYGKVTVNAEDQNIDFQLSGVTIETVYVCTAAIALSDISGNGEGGCLSADIDDDGPYNVIGVGAVAEYLGATISTTEPNEGRFSFLTFDTPRTDIYVHVQALLDVTFATGRRRRVRMLLQSEEEEEATQFRSFVGTASVQRDEDGQSSTDDLADLDGAAGCSVGFGVAMIVFSAAMMA